MTFSEVFKDEINANDEQKIYNGVKRIIRKYSDNKEAILVMNEFTRVISGGASLDEIFRIAGDESSNPTLESGLTVDGSCRTDNQG